MRSLRRDRIERSEPRLPRGTRWRGVLHGAFAENGNARALDFVAASLRRGVNRVGPAQRHSAVATTLLDHEFLGTKLTAMTDKNAALVPEEGWHCLHLFYRIEYGQWQLMGREEQNAAKTNLSSLVQEVRAMDSTQLLTLSMVTPKADLGFMLITPDLHSANKIEKRLSLSLGADVLTPVYSYLSLTEESEYITSEDEYAKTLEPSGRKDPVKFDQAVATFHERTKHYRQERVYPTLPDWPIVCFYHMSKRRGEERNWDGLAFGGGGKVMGGNGG